MSLGALLLGLHVLGAMAWVGGMFFALGILAPAMAFLDPPVRMALHEQVLRRFVRVVWHVWPVMLATGLAMEYLFYGGVWSAPWPLQVMTASGLAMTAVFIVIARGPWRTFRRSLAHGEVAGAAAALSRVRVLVTANLVLGVFTTVVAMLDT